MPYAQVVLLKSGQQNASSVGGASRSAGSACVNHILQSSCARRNPEDERGDHCLKKISIKGCQFAYEIMGTGSPTVVLETGVGAESSEWGPVAASIARSKAVFRYDRAGRGESGPGQGNRDALTMVDELGALLEATQTKGPYLLVGHSFGGLLMRLFANARIADVHGLVLVESMHHRQFQLLGPAFPDSSPSDPPPLVQMRDFWTEGCSLSLSSLAAGGSSPTMPTGFNVVQPVALGRGLLLF